MFRLIIAASLAFASGAKYSGWRKDPDHCEVCLHVVETINHQISTVGDDFKRNLGALEGALHRHCAAGNKNLVEEERIFCKEFTPQIRKLSAYFVQDLTPKELCKRIDRLVPTACHHKFTSAAGKSSKKALKRVKKSFQSTKNEL